MVFFRILLIFLALPLAAFADVTADLQEHIKYNPKGPNTIGYIYIGDRSTEINQATWLYVKMALDSYKESKPSFIIMELNTPGGEVFSAEKISDALKEIDTQYNIPVVAFINNWAMSAGALLAYSCRYIAVVKDASMGAAEPIQANAEGKMEAASEKVNSALRADFANRATFFGRNPLIAEAMVDKDVILVLRAGKIIKLDYENQIKNEGPNPDVIISPKGKLLTLDSEQLMEYGVANMLILPQKLDLITPAEQEKGVWPANKSLLFTYPFFKTIPQATIKAYLVDWKTHFFMLLSNTTVASLLFLGLVVGFYLEMSTPGATLPGTIAAICLFFILLSSFALEAINWLEVILLITGGLIIMVEIFVLPTFGLLGFVGVIFFLMGLFGLMIPGLGSVSFELDTQTFNGAGEFVLKRLGMLSATLVLALLIIAILARYAKRTRAFNRFILSGHEQNGYIAGAKTSSLPQPGKEGKVVSTLRPSGKIVIDGVIYDAMSSGEFIEIGTDIVVSRFDGSDIIVEEKQEE